MGAWQLPIDDTEYARLRPAGFWRASDQPQFPDPRAYVDENWSENERRAVSGYLRTAPQCRSWKGYSQCRICGKSDRELGAADLTDGVWLWPEGFAHYVDHHGVKPAEEFLDHLRSMHFELPHPVLVSAEVTAQRIPAYFLKELVRSDDSDAIRFRRRPGAGGFVLQIEVRRDTGCYQIEYDPAALAKVRAAQSRPGITESIATGAVWFGLFVVAVLVSVWLLQPQR